MTWKSKKIINAKDRRPVGALDRPEDVFFGGQTGREEPDRERWEKGCWVIRPPVHNTTCLLQAFSS